MSLSNDSEEGIFTINVLDAAYRNSMDAVNKLKSPGQIGGLFSLGALYSATPIYSELDGIRKSNDGLGLCMSSEGDMLSQWRGYADDGHGVSIGFSRDALSSLTSQISNSAYVVELIQVVYDRRLAGQRLQPLVKAIMKYVDDGALAPKNGLFGILDVPTDPHVIERRERAEKAKQAFDDLVTPVIVRELYRYKNPAFAEEREWRLLTTFQPEKVPPMFEVHPTRAILKPYVNLSIRDHKKHLVGEVIIGPKNATPNAVVEAFLRASGHPNAIVRRSNSTYR